MWASVKRFSKKTLLRIARVLFNAQNQAAKSVRHIPA